MNKEIVTHVVFTPGAMNDLAGMNRYVGLTYPRFLGWKIWRDLIARLWKKFLCPRHIHMFDEVASSEHYLVCDVCNLAVHIALIETSEEGCARAKELKYIETTATEKSELDHSHCIRIR